MAIQILSEDQTKLEELLNASVIHRDDAKILVLLRTGGLTEAQEAMLETEGISVNGIKTKTQYIRTDDVNSGLTLGQWLVEFEL